MKNKKIEFYAKIIKAGNSYCVRIPKTAAKYLGVDLNDIVKVRISLPSLKDLPSKVLRIFKDSIKELKEFSDKDLKVCILRYVLEFQLTSDLNQKEKERVSKAFEKIIKMENQELYRKYMLFKKLVTKEHMTNVMKKLKEDKKFREVIEMQLGSKLGRQ